ncbi:MAG: CPBP family intramembrane metalloprotease [Candidatus Lokiarchaeota archaeon]|nr:CPBP family intramembrane metalloprotease [Candidatus Lokiarchaeota archaeon]
MAFEIENLWFFIAFIPLILLTFVGLNILKKKKNEKIIYRFILIEILLFLTRVFLLVFDMGAFPYLVMDPIFYILAFIMGVLLMYVYLYKVEKKDFAYIGWFRENLNLFKDIVAGILGCVILVVISVLLMMGLSDYTLITEFNISIDKFVTALFFGFGAIYEEWFYRGFLLKYEKLNERNRVIFSSLMFVGIHLGYLPLTGYGMFYISITIMAFMLAFLAKKFSILSSTVAHGLFVFIGIITI